MCLGRSPFLPLPGESAYGFPFIDTSTVDESTIGRAYVDHMGTNHMGNHTCSSVGVTHRS